MRVNAMPRPTLMTPTLIRINRRMLTPMTLR